MPRPSRAKSDSQAQPRSPALSRRSLQLSPRKSTKSDNRGEAQLKSPTSPTTRKAPKKEGPIEPRPTTPEGWIELALTKLRQGTITKVAEAVLDLAYLEPDLLEFLITANEEIRDTVYEAVCGPTFPRAREEWMDSASSILLERFQTYLNRLPPDLADRRVDEAGRQIALLFTALEALDHITFEAEQKDELEEEEADTFFKIKVKQSQKKRKAEAGNANRARRNTVTVDPRVFTAVHFEPPTCLDDVLDIEYTLLFRLREVLEMLLTAFENPELTAHAKALFFKDPLQFLPTKSKSTPETSTEDAPRADAGSIATSQDASAFPHIRPLAAAKYFDERSGFGEWPVVVSGRAVSYLRQMRRRDNRVFAKVHKKITELSQGFFSDDNQLRLVGLDAEVPIYEAKVSRDVRIVYQIDLDTDVDAKIDRQIIKLYGVYTHAQLENRMWSLVSHYHINRRGKEYRRRCSFRATHRAPGQNVTLPAQFKHEEDIDAPVEISPTDAPSLEGMADEDFLNLHSLIALEKFIPMSRSLIDSILNDSDSTHVFHVSAKEKEIIYHDSACFVLGRSGTGKTTSILFKMIGVEKSFESLQEVAKPRQVFITQSRILAQRVREYYQNLVMSSSGISETIPKSAEEQVLADLDDEDADAFGLPSKYSMLEGHHFPLFITFDQLCSLLEADFGLHFRRSARTKAHFAAEKRFAIAEVADVKIDLDQEDEIDQVDVSQSPLSPPPTASLEHERIQEAKQAAVTFEIFVAAYWPHFDYRLTKGLDSALVYSEFLGVIEGSESALGSKSGALCREEYMNLSHRKSSFASQRGRIYDLYEAYRKWKQQLGGYDSAERTHALVTATNARVPGHKLDCLYIDEAQDNLLVDIKLLHNLSNNPHGIFVAGDTAQTISAGSSFRFEDLKAFMWRLEEQDDTVRRGKRKAIHPTLFQLAETGLIDGPKPVFFSGWERGVVRFEQFLRGEGNNKIDFGASQVILVRNEAARDALRAQVGEIGLILTLYESKGLEFDDVLLYNFFEDSVPTTSTWRVILHGLHEVNVGPAPRFDEVRHAVICTELKNLYVGLTRARNHCWIWDVSEKADPMKVFWARQNLIVLCGPDDPMPQLGVSSSQDDWAKSGRLLFNKQLYPQAMFCFEKADLLVERDIAAAYEARKQARLLQASKSVDWTTRRSAFRDAATDFRGCAILSKGKQQISCYLRAAECFMQAEEWKSAAEAFSSANDFNMAAKNFRRAGCFDEAVEVVEVHRDEIQDNVAGEIIGVARLEYLRTAKYEKAGKLFDNVEEQLEYMDDYGFDVAQIHVLERRKQYEQAAEVAFNERNIVEGVRLLLCSDKTTSVHYAVKRALHGLWTTLPFGPHANKLDNTAIASLIQHLTSDKSRLLDVDEIQQLEVFQVLQAKDENRAMALAQSHGILAHKPQTHSLGRSMLALLCFSYISHLLAPTGNSNIPDFISKCKLALTYLSQLLRLGRGLDLPCPYTQKLLGFEPVESSNFTVSEGNESASPEYLIYSTSLMFEDAQKTPGALAPTPSVLGLSSLLSSELDTRRLTINAIYNVLRSEVRAIHGATNLLKYLHPCLDFAIFGRCNWPDCGRQEVNSFRLPDEQRQDSFNSRARALIIHAQIIHLYQAQTHVDEAERREFRRVWARRIYELLMPHFPPLGSAICIDRARIPEKDRGFSVIASWCEDALHDLDPGYGAKPRFLSDVLAYLDIGFRVQHEAFAIYAPKLHSRRLVRWRDDLMLRTPGAPGYHFVRHHSVVHDFIDFYIRKSNDVIQRVIRAIHHVVFGQLTIEANVLVHILEFIGREVIVHCRRWSRGPDGVFDGLLLPQSWALDLAKNPFLLPQKGFRLTEYMHTLYKTLELLRAHEPNASPLYGFNSRLGRLMRSTLIVRVCRLLILVCCNIGFDPIAKNEVRQAIAHSLTGPGDIHNGLCARFAWTESWWDLENALTYSPLNRGADELVYLSLRTSSSQSHSINGVKSISYTSILELGQLLSLDGPTKSSGATLDPAAKPFVPLAQAHTLASNSEDLAKANEAADQPKTETFTSLVHSQVDYLSSIPKPQIERTLTRDEVDMGRRILFYYRRYASGQRVKARLAVRTIWAYYSRYRLLYKAPRTAMGDRIRKLHTEYKQDVESIDCPMLLVKGFQRHERILLGYMPHVAVYLRGIEDINQQQKRVNKQRLHKVQHEELERVQLKMKACSAFSKQLKSLIRGIVPGSSALHRIDSLREQVKRVDDMRSAIIQAFGEDAIPADLEEHYPLGILAILFPPRTRTEPKPLRPELNMSDLGNVF